MYKSKIKATGYIMAFVIAILISMAIKEAMPTYNIGDVYVEPSPDIDNPFLETYEVDSRIDIIDVKGEYCQYKTTFNVGVKYGTKYVLPNGGWYFKEDSLRYEDTTVIKSGKCSSMKMKYALIPADQVSKIVLIPITYTERGDVTYIGVNDSLSHPKPACVTKPYGTGTITTCDK